MATTSAISNYQLLGEHMEAFMSDIDEHFFFFDTHYNFLYLNRSAEDLLGKPKAELIGRNIWEVFPIEQNTALFNILVRSAEGERKIKANFYSQMYQKWFHLSMFSTIQGISVQLCDIQKDKLMFEKLSYDQVALETFLDNIPNIAFAASTAGTNIYLNKKWTEYTGLEWDGGYGKLWKKVIHPEDYERVTTSWFQHTVSALPFQAEYRIRNRQGEYRWHLGRSNPVLDSLGAINFWIGTVTDIQDLKETQDKLKESVHITNKIAEASLDLVTVMDYKTLRLTYVNRAPLNSRFTMTDLIGASLERIKAVVNPVDHKRFLEYFKRFENASDDDMLQCEYQMINSREEWRWVCSRGKVFERDKEGRPVKIIVVTQDITPRKEMEDAARQNVVMQKLLEKKDEFMSVASHELKTPITTMKASVQILQRLVDSHTDYKILKVFITKANEQINRLTSLINDLLDNARIQAGKVALRITKFKIAEVIEECAMHNSNQYKIIVKNQVDDVIEGDKMRIAQVLTNFITNAVKYSPGEDTVVIETEKDAESLRVAVTDFGIGIPEEKVERVFDRFFRVEETSSEFSGLGLGLYISAEIIKRHHGEYGVISEPGKGSTFWFKIPFTFREE